MLDYEYIENNMSRNGNFTEWLILAMIGFNRKQFSF